MEKRFCPSKQENWPNHSRLQMTGWNRSMKSLFTQVYCVRLLQFSLFGVSCLIKSLLRCSNKVQIVTVSNCALKLPPTYIPLHFKIYLKCVEIINVSLFNLIVCSDCVKILLVRRYQKFYFNGSDQFALKKSLKTNVIVDLQLL